MSRATTLSAPAPEQELAPAHLLVLFESTANGVAAARGAADIAGRSGARLTVATLAAQAPDSHCCGSSPHAYNRAVREAAREELREARDAVGAGAENATFQVLTGTPQRELASWVADRGFDLVLVPRHRLVPGGHWAARQLRRAGGPAVQLY